MKHLLARTSGGAKAGRGGDTLATASHIAASREAARPVAALAALVLALVAFRLPWEIFSAAGLFFDRFRL